MAHADAEYQESNDKPPDFAAELLVYELPLGSEVRPCKTIK